MSVTDPIRRADASNFALSSMMEESALEPAATPVSAQAEISVLIPVFNEERSLMHLLERVRAVPVAKEILIVDDCSTDRTREILRTEVEGKFPDVRVLYHDHNQGKGAAIRTAIPHATGRYSIVQDGDLEYDPQDYIAILKAFQEHDV